MFWRRNASVLNVFLVLLSSSEVIFDSGSGRRSRKDHIWCKPMKPVAFGSKVDQTV